MVVCAACGEENPERARFCLDCAAPLTSESTARVEERKVVTVLFCDLVGFTARAEQADPEDVAPAARQPYQSLLRREIERFGGTVEKFIGDAVMAVFGAPVAHEDDAERRVRAALRILGARSAGAERGTAGAGPRGADRRQHRRGGRRPRRRPEQGEGMVTGDVVNTASRLQGVAPVGGVVGREHDLPGDSEPIDYESSSRSRSRARPSRQPVWRALAARSRLGVDVDQRASTPFIGREGELGSLQ